MRSWAEVVKTSAHRPLAPLLTLGFLMSACGRSEGQGDLDRVNQATQVPQDVIEIIRAIDAGDIPKLTDLLDRGATPTPDGSPLSPIHAAITHFEDGQLVCDSTALKLLLDHKADPNFVDQESGFSALENALALGDMRCASLLKEAGASIERHGNSGQSILQFAVKGAVHTGDIGILNLVLSWGVAPNVRSSRRGFTALHEAAWPSPGRAGAAEPIVAHLLRSGTDPCIADSDGNTALEIAKSLGGSAAVQKLLADAMRECARR